jgi:hypothetical protein
MLEFDDFSSFKRANVAPTLFAEVLVAEVLTQSRTPFVGPRGILARSRSALERGVFGCC